MRLDLYIVLNVVLDLICSCFFSPPLFFQNLGQSLIEILEVRPLFLILSLEIKCFKIGCTAKKIFQLLGQSATEKFQLLGALAVGRYTQQIDYHSLRFSLATTFRRKSEKESGLWSWNQLIPSFLSKNFTPNYRYGPGVE